MGEIEFNSTFTHNDLILLLFLSDLIKLLFLKNLVIKLMFYNIILKNSLISMISFLIIEISLSFISYNKNYNMNRCFLFVIYVL